MLTVSSGTDSARGRGVRPLPPCRRPRSHAQDYGPLPYTDEIARTWGEISADATRRGRPRPQNDTWIAACSLVYDLPLATLNVKDFADFAEHEGLILVGT